MIDLLTGIVDHVEELVVTHAGSLNARAPSEYPSERLGRIDPRHREAADTEHVVLGAQTGLHRLAIHGFDREIDAGLLQLRLHELSHRRVGLTLDDIQSRVKTTLVPGFGEQLLGACGIMTVLFECRVKHPVLVGDQGWSDLSSAEGYHLHHRLTIEAEQNRLSQPNVVKRWLGNVECEHDVPAIAGPHKPKAGIATHRLQIPGRDGVDDMDVAGLYFDNFYRAFLDEPDDGAVEIRQWFSIGAVPPVIGVAFENNSGSRLPTGELEGAGPHRIPAIILPVRLDRGWRRNQSGEGDGR